MTKILCAVLVLVLPAAVWADDPKFGGCLEKRDVCFAPTVSVNVVAVSLYDGSLTKTFDLGIGYGATLAASKWYRTGLSVTTSFPQYEAGRRMMPSLLVSFAEYARFGLACPTFVAGGFQRNAQFLISFGSDFGRW